MACANCTIYTLYVHGNSQLDHPCIIADTPSSQSPSLTSTSPHKSHNVCYLHTQLGDILYFRQCKQKIS